MPLPSYGPAPTRPPVQLPPRALLSSARQLGAAPNSPLTLTGVSATVIPIDAQPATAVSLDTAPQVVADTPAIVTVALDAPEVYLDGGAVEIIGETAEVTGSPHEGLVVIGGGRLGDDFANPFLVGGSGDSLTIATSGFTVEATEPAAVFAPPLLLGNPGTVLVKTTWTQYTPNANGTLVITGSVGAADLYQIELFEGTSLDDLVRADVANSGIFYNGAEIAPTITTVVDAGTPVYLRLWPTGVTTSLTVTMTLAFTADASQSGLLSLNVATPTFSTSPGVIRADVIGGTPNATLVFDLVGTSASFANPPGVGLGTAVASYEADTSGNLYGASIALPTVSAGTYTLRVTDSSLGLTANAAIQVEADPIVPPSTIPPDNPIGTISNGTTVKYWVFQDPLSGGLGTYVFPINPVTMTSPHAPRNVSLEHTVAVDGHDIIWEGAYKANEWRFQGIVLAQIDYDTLVAFAAVNRRFWVVDHRDRAWICSIESIGWTKHRAPYNDWAWDYDVSALIYDGPTSI